ncbi:MAG: hypothetical protein ACFFAH_06910 [Promethearchaeota archaeon]
MTLKRKYFIPLVIFIIPTLIITAIIWNFEPPGILTIIGYIILIIAIIGTYYQGIKAVMKDLTT